MKRKILTVSAALSLGIICVSAATTVVPPKEGWIPVYSQDFSAMKAGTAESPDEEQLADAASSLPAEMLGGEEGWTGFGVYQAGEACALNCPNFGGFINTPETQMTGLIHVTFRMKSLDPIATGKVMACRGGILNPRQVDAETSLRQFDTDGWQEYEMYFHNQTTDPVFVQINTLYMADGKKGIVIDDLKVEYNPTYVPPVKAAATTAYTNDGFGVQWIPLRDTENPDYLVSLYRLDKKADKGVSVDEDFSGWKESADGKLPENTGDWKLVKMFPNHPVLMEHEGVKGIAMGHHEEIVELPSNGGKFTELSFDVTNLRGDDPNAWGAQIQVQGWDGNNWKAIISASAYGMDDLDVERYDLGAWEDKGPDMYDPTIPAFRGLYSKIRFLCESANYGAKMLISNVHFETTEPSETVALKSDVLVEEDKIAFDGLDMGESYVVGIKTRENGNVSAEAFYEPYGIALPELNEPTNISEDGFTANWQPVNNAAFYIVSSAYCKELDEADEAYVLAEADLSDLKVGTEDVYEPWELGNSFERTDLSKIIGEGWEGFGNVAIDGAVGCKGTFMPGMYGILSPELHLGNDGGRFTFKATVWGGEFSSLSLGTATGITESEIFEYEGDHELTMQVEGGQNHDSIAIFSSDGQPFFIKEFSITQNLPEGARIIVSSISKEVAGNTDCLNISAADADGLVRAFDVAAFRKDFTREAFSGYSPLKYVTDAPESAGIVKNTSESVSVDGLTVKVSLIDSEEVMVSSVDGKVIAKTVLPAGENSFMLPNSGLYIIKVGNNSYKVVGK